MSIHDEEDQQLRSAALQNAQSILAARQRAEAELIEAKEALELKTMELARTVSMIRATLESTSDGILVTDEAGRITDFNETFVRTWGIPREIMETCEHRRVLEYNATLFPDPRQFLATVDVIYASSPSETLDVLELADGRVLERSSRIQWVDDRNVGRVWSVRDVTERRRAEQEHAYLAAIVAWSIDAIISKTLDGIITSWNTAAEHTFGYTASEAVGQSIGIIIPVDRLDEERSILERLRRGVRIEHFETVRRTKDGRLINVSCTISPVRDATGRIIGASKVARDVTEREQLLAREQSARTRAEEANRLKDEFLATVSHELRTPLNAILGWSQMLHGGKLDAAKTRHVAEVIERNARAQAQVIEDLLDVSRIIAGKLRLNVQAVMPATVVESALESVRPMAEAKGVSLHAALDPQAGPVSGDPSRLQQIVWNLLSNAIKFTPKGGQVQVRLERVDSHVEIAVSDTGRGLSPEFIPHAFDRFRQADASTSRTTGGLGLGLAIVRHLAELHGGAVVAESPGEGKGATFTVSLPVRAVYSRPPEDGERVHPTAGGRGVSRVLEGAPNLRSARILVVDDEPDTRELLREVLEQCGAEVREAGSVRQALELVKEWRPSVIVSDIGMPGEDGYLLIRKVRDREKETGERIPAVALTAYARSEDRVRALQAGYQVHTAKPIEPMEFALMVAGVLQSKRPTS